MKSDMKKKVYIWGTGYVAVQYINIGEVDDGSLLGFVESHKTKEFFCEKKVYEPWEISNDNFDFIIVCVYGKTHVIYQTALQYGILPEKLIFIDNWQWFDNTSVFMDYPHHLCNPINAHIDMEKIKRTFPSLYRNFILGHEMRAKRYFPVQENAYDWTNKDSVLRNTEFLKKEYWGDYFRYRSFELVVNEINRSNVKGNVAELGVFRGKFSKLINAKFPDRKLYLFDTFGSFDSDEFKREMKAGRCEESFFEVFKNTSEKLVLDIMPYPENCIIRKGLFPDTAIGLDDEEYAFVSIDVDLEDSILAGLRYFYPRVSSGGFLFLHDYNNYFLEGVKVAVAAYEKQIGQRLMKVPLADEGGTLVICK